MALKSIASTFIILFSLYTWATAFTAESQEELWQKFSDDSTSLLKTGNYSAALQKAEQALDAAEKSFGSHDDRIVTTLMTMARLSFYTGAYSAAEPFYHRALKIREEKYGPGHPKTGAILNGLGMYYVLMADAEQARAYLQRAHDINRKTLGRRHGRVKFLTKILKQLDRADIGQLREIAAIAKDLIARPSHLEFEDLNFKYRIPPLPYIRINVEKTNPDAAVAFIRAKPEIVFVVIAEKAGADLGIGLMDWVEIIKENFKSTYSSIATTDVRRHVVNNMNGVSFYTEASNSDHEVFLAHWVYYHNGYLYQLVASGVSRHKEQIRAEAETLWQNFEQIDPTRIAGSENLEPVDLYTSETFGYSLDLRNTRWKKLADFEESIQHADIACLYETHSSMFVIPFFYGANAPQLDAVLQVFLNVVNITFPNENITNLIRLHEFGMDGYVFNFKRVSGDETDHYRIKILAGRRVAYLIVVWSEKGVDFLTELAGEAFQSFRFQDDPTIDFNPLEVTERRKNTHTEFVYALGLFYQNAKQHDRSLTYFREALKLDEQDISYLTNALDSYFQLGRFHEALELIDSSVASLKENPLVRSWRAWILNEIGRTGDAIEIFQMLFRENYRNDDDFIGYVGLLVKQERWEEAEEVFTSYLRAGGSMALRIEQANLLYMQRKYEQAIELLENLQDGLPFNTDIAYALIENYHALGQYKDILTICNEFADNGYNSAAVFTRKGEAEYELKWYRKAKQSFENALKKAPEDINVQEWIKHVSALLGEGDNTVIKDMIDPVPLPQELISQLPPLTAQPADNSYDSFYLNLITGVSFDSGGKQKETYYHRIKVVDGGGVNRFSTMQIDFDPLYERLYVNVLIVRDDSDEIISHGKPSDYFIIDSQDESMYTTDRTLHIPVPNLLPGYTIELTFTIEQLANADQFRFRRYFLAGSRPILLSAIFYLGNRHTIDYKNVNSPSPEELENGLFWHLKDPPTYRWAPLQAAYEKYLPLVMLNDAGNQWQDLGTNYLGEIEDKLVLDDEVRSIAGQLIGTTDTSQEKIDKLARYVQRDYTYKAIEFGRRALMPNSATEIIANKYGDCKDHTILLHHLLKAVDIPSFLALVSTDFDIYPSLPSLDQFNHMIIYIPTEDQGIFVDATDKGLDLRGSIPRALGERRAFILNPDKPELSVIPKYKSDGNKLTLKRHISIINDVDLAVRVNVDLGGHVASAMRDQFRGIDQADYLKWGQYLVTRYIQSATVTSLQIRNLYENSSNLEIEMEYRVNQRRRPDDNRIAAKMPDIWEKYYLELQPVSARISPFEIHYPFIFESVSVFSTPPGYILKKQGPLNAGDTAPFAVWESVTEKEDTECTIRFTANLNTGVFDPHQYESYQAMMDRALLSVSPEIWCDKVL